MLKTIEELEAETRESELALLAQYKKELADLENRSGLASCMSEGEIANAIKDLKEHINNLRELYRVE